MTATVADVREGIKAVLQTVDGLDTVYGYMPGSPTPPCAIVGWPEPYDAQTVLNGDKWQAPITVQVLVGAGENRNADLRLGALIEPIVAAFNDNPEVDDNAEAIVMTVDSFGTVVGPDAGVLYLSAIFHLDVIAG